MSLQWVSNTDAIRPERASDSEVPSDETIAQVAERLNELRHSSAP